ncbi:MAG TPA: lipid-A-disaccharide synthase [Caulobacterales bacterium]|nr:lipid-A-disaccharide synthase [Caulobacterales bacterium]
MSRRVFLVAGETSGDALGAELITALRAQADDLEFAGVGGPAMAACGVPSQADISALAVLGLVEGLKAYPRVKRAVDETAAAAAAFKPDIAVLIDSWGFTSRVARRLRRDMPGVKLVKYIGPQVWATRPGRAKTLAGLVDHLICIHDFEAPFYRPFGLPVTVSGAPALSRVKRGDAAAFRARHALRAGEEILLLLPGSRRAEIENIAPVLEEAAARLCGTRPGLLVVCLAAPSIAELVRQRAAAWPFPHKLVLDEREKEDVFAAASVALAASGTVTTEVALQGAPVVVGYKIGWVTWVIARLFLLRTRFITLMNVAAGLEVAPEFVQTRFTASNIIRAAAPLLDNAEMRARQIALQEAALDKMGRGGRPAAEIAAEAVLRVLD